MKVLIPLFFLIGILLWVPTSNADIYSWTDENGVKHFGNQPPENAANVKMVFKEVPHDEAADQKNTEAQNRELTELIRDLEEEEQREAAEKRKKSAKAEQNREPSQQERAAAERERLEAKIAELVEQPLEYFGSERNKRARIGYYRYRLEALNTDPNKYFSNPVPFEGNVKNSEQ
jgi:Skp family chaperone for outer membrane proteins